MGLVNGGGGVLMGLFVRGRMMNVGFGRLGIGAACPDRTS